MPIQESGEMYLETILILSQTRDCVRAVDVAEYMGYSKPSVSRAISLLKTAGLVTADRAGALSLTENGRTVAEKIYDRHTLLTRMLTGLGVSEQQAAVDACRMEHILSDESFDAIKRHFPIE